MKRIHLLISGKVQGVCFRAYTKEEADMIGVTGWVRNTEDDDVEVLIEGKDDKVEELIAYCNSGPKTARVDNIKIEEEEYVGEFDSFKIIY